MATRQFMAFLIYCATVAAAVTVLESREPWLGWGLAWTIVQGESSYIFWRYVHHLHPLRGYLAIVLTTATLHLTAMWFIFFKGEGSLLTHPIARFFFNPDRYPRLQANLEKKRSRASVFRVGLIPMVWWTGFLYLRKHPMKRGVVTILAGNATKLTIFALVFWLGIWAGWAFVAIGMMFLVSFLTPRLMERLLPNNNHKRSLR